VTYLFDLSVRVVSRDSGTVPMFVSMCLDIGRTWDTEIDLFVQCTYVCLNVTFTRI